jgi:RHS repeat-associated protein
MRQTPYALMVRFAVMISVTIASIVFTFFSSAQTKERCSSHPLTKAGRSILARAISLGTMLLLLGCHVYAQINLSSAYRRAITIDHTKVQNTDQTNFPVLIDVSGLLSGVKTANGYDIIFTSDLSGQHMLDHEIEAYNGKTEEATFWVRIPTLSHTSDTTIYIFYGIPNITTSQENKGGVWSNGYLSVYHFGKAGLTDSASAGYTLLGSTSGWAGMIGGGATFNGDPGTYLYHDSVSAYPSGASPVTLESWVQIAPGAVDPLGVDIIGFGGNSGSGSRIALGRDSNYPLTIEFENMGIGSSASIDNNWHHLVGVYGGGELSTATDLLYLDGVQLSTIIVGGTPAITTTEFKIGGIPMVSGCCAFNGSVDEVRVSSVPRSADWVATEYANESSPSTFYSVGLQAVGTGSGPGSLTCFPSTVDAGSNTTCSVGLASGATGQVTFSLDGQYSTVATPTSSGQVDALIDLASASVASHTVAFSYPGDGVHPPATGNATVTVQAGGSTLPNEGIVYQFSITQSDGVTSGYAPNSNIVAYTDSVNGQWSMPNGYDSLNRLVGATQTPVTGPQQSFCWVYDSFGNRQTQAVSPSPFGGTPGSDCVARATGTLTGNAWVHYNANNQPTESSQSMAPYSLQPDARGNMGTDGQSQFLYDAEGRICAVNGGGGTIGYLYNAEGQRVAKGTLTQFSCDMTTNSSTNMPTNGFTVTNEYIQNASGGQLTEFDGQGRWVHTNVSAEGQLVATYDNDGQGVHFHLADWLGTRRMQTDNAGNPELKCQSGPFGDAQLCSPIASNAADVTEQHFNGKERDIESGLDYFGARYYGSNMGRWMSPDWSEDPDPVPYVDLENPQSLNLYGYVGNNPLSKNDPNGHIMLNPDCPCNIDYGSLWRDLIRRTNAMTDWELSTLRNFFGKNKPVVPPVVTPAQTANPNPDDPNRKYQKSDKHGRYKKGNVSAAPKDGQTALDNSVQVKDTSPRRIGVDPVNQEIVVLDQTSEGVFHGHVRAWSELTSQMQNALQESGLTSSNGTIK